VFIVSTATKAMFFRIRIIHLPFFICLKEKIKINQHVFLYLSPKYIRRNQRHRCNGSNIPNKKNDNRTNVYSICMLMKSVADQTVLFIGKKSTIRLPKLLDWLTPWTKIIEKKKQHLIHTYLITTKVVGTFKT
jgi:hypothetical protein